MPINYQQIHVRIKEIGAGARERRKTMEERRKKARDLLTAYASELDFLRAKVDSAKAADANIRCAYPLDEPLASSHPAPVEAPDAVLIAADGSQIIPDRHDAVQFGLVNVGAIVLKLNSGEAPKVYTDSQLLFDHELYTETGSITQDSIEFSRDIAERKKLLELAKEHEGILITLTDGPVEIWGAKSASEGDYLKTLEQHKSILSQLQSRDVTVAGYVDKPGADLVIRLLELTQLDMEQMKEVRKQHPLRGVTDRWLFSGILKKGERSGVFAIQSSSRARYTGSLSLHFFYLNVGDANHPAIARVEIPEWVAKDKDELELLHSALIQQCKIMGAKPYPYILHRAHEIAVVSFEEKKQITQMIQQMQLNNQETLDEISSNVS
ncbi:MAG: hypothetical protein A3K45_06880 [Chloroflexi bacterium RIFOXYC12_FULL_59_14]|nr:MAG: hypothetical protein A3K45_06880 [Chloroflexi bacterium RIFOXYC12_FULL_59_14]